MLIDGFTVVAQTVNFLILLWLMKRFLYKPVLDAISAREQRIASILADASAKQATAQQDLEALTKRSATFDQERATLMSAARDEAGAERQRLLIEARSVADQQRAANLEQLSQQRVQLRDSLVRHARIESFAVARKALADLASTSLELSIADAFIGRLRTLQDLEKQQLRDAFATSTDAGIVRSAFELPEPERAAVQVAVTDILAATRRLRFEVGEDLVAGIELTVNGQKLSWSIDDYLKQLDSSVSTLLTASTATA